MIACVSGDGMLHEAINGVIQGYEPDSAHDKVCGEDRAWSPYRAYYDAFSPQ